MFKFTSDQAISSSEATAFIQDNEKNIELFYAKKLEAKITKNKTEVKALGSRMVGKKTTSAAGEGTLTIYDVTSEFRSMFLEYIKTGVDRYVNILCSNKDDTTPWGAESKVLTGVNFDEVIIAQFDSDDSVLEQELPFTFEGVELLSTYNK